LYNHEKNIEFLPVFGFTNGTSNSIDIPKIDAMTTQLVVAKPSVKFVLP